MKRIFIVLTMCFMFVLCGCSKNSKDMNSLEGATNYINSLNSYSLTCNMTIYRADKEVKSVITVDYLKPCYYKVKFSTANGHEQLIVKNNEGVYVLTPSLNKQFKFDSEWPLNSTHAYLLNAITNDIKRDSNAKYDIDGNNIIIEAKLLDNARFSTMKFYYNIVDKKPVKSEFYDTEGNVKVLAEFIDFTANPTISTDLFNPDLIMEQNSNEGTTNEEEETSIGVTVSYVLEGSNLASSQALDDCTVLVYSGEKSYTIIVKKIEVYQSCIAMDSYNNFEILESGLLLSGNSCYKYYVNDLEVSIYSNSLTFDDVLEIISNGLIIE